MNTTTNGQDRYLVRLASGGLDHLSIEDAIAHIRRFGAATGATSEGIEAAIAARAAR